MNTNNENRLALCLSGGGFRASFYHIGVLARMAELGLLKHVQVISTVSGGSIVGVAYYMKLKALLEKYADSEIRDDHYVEMVKELEGQFLSAVQKNLRMHTFCNPFKNVWMALPHYSRSDAIGQVYEDYIYREILKDKESKYAPDMKDEKSCMSIRELLIHPEGNKDFHPHKHNATRKNKVPILTYPHIIVIKNNELGIKMIEWTRMAFFDLVLSVKVNIRKTPCEPLRYLIPIYENTVKGYIRNA